MSKRLSSRLMRQSSAYSVNKLSAIALAVGMAFSSVGYAADAKADQATEKKWSVNDPQGQFTSCQNQCRSRYLDEH